MASFVGSGVRWRRAGGGWRTAGGDLGVSAPADEASPVFWPLLFRPSETLVPLIIPEPSYRHLTHTYLSAF